jgi:heme-degrading monooxygenase HmoA
LVSVTIGRPTKWAAEEYMMISIWENEQFVEDFAGENWHQAVIPEGMEKYVAECWVHHYENFGQE